MRGLAYGCNYSSQAPFVGGPEQLRFIYNKNTEVPAHPPREKVEALPLRNLLCWYSGGLPPI